MTKTPIDPEIEKIAVGMLPSSAEASVVAVLASAISDVLRTGQASVIKVSPAIASLFPDTAIENHSRVHYLACGAAMNGSFGYIIRPRPNAFPKTIDNREDWVELLALWELVGFVEGFPTSPLSAIETTEAENDAIRYH